MSRATFTNGLSWQEDEARAYCSSILYELTRGLNWWDATAVYDTLLDAWLICFSYSYQEDTTVGYTWCTMSDSPEPPPPYGPGPPPPDYPDGYADEVTIWAEPYAGASCWSTDPVDEVPFDEDVGPWGGYQCIIDGVGVGDMHLQVYPIAWTIFAVTWRYEWEVVGGSVGFRDVDEAPGFLPNVLLDIGEVTDCPGVQLLLSTVVWP